MPQHHIRRQGQWTPQRPGIGHADGQQHRWAHARSPDMQVVHRNTPQSGASNVFDSPQSPGATGRKYAEANAARRQPQHQQQDTTARRLDLDEASAEPEPASLRLEPADDDGAAEPVPEEDDEPVADAGEAAALHEQLATTLELLSQSKGQVDQLRSDVGQLRSELELQEPAPGVDDAAMRQMVAAAVHAAIAPARPSPGAALSARASSAPATPISVQHAVPPARIVSSVRAASPARPATKTPERHAAASANRSEHRGGGSSKKSACEHVRSITAAFAVAPAGRGGPARAASPKHAEAMKEDVYANEGTDVDGMVASLVPSEGPRSSPCPFCGMNTLEGGFSYHVTACGQKDAAQRLHRLKFVVRPHLFMLKPVHVWKRAVELHFALKYWQQIHHNILFDESADGGENERPEGKARLAGDKDFVILSKSDLGGLTENIYVGRSELALGFGLSASTSTFTRANGGGKTSGGSMTQVAKKPPRGSPAAEAGIAGGLSGTKILRVDGTLVRGNLRELLQSHGDGVTLTTTRTPTREDVANGHTVLQDMAPPLLRRSEAEQKQHLTEMICAVADHGSNYYESPDKRAPCPTCCFSSNFGTKVQLYSLTQLVNHCFRDHWHKGDQADVHTKTDPAGAMAAAVVTQPKPVAAVRAAIGAPASGPKTGSTAVAHKAATSLAQAAAAMEQEASQQRQEIAEQAAAVAQHLSSNGSKNPWARPQQEGSAYAHTALRPDWKPSGASTSLELKRKPRLARHAEASLFGDVQSHTDGAETADMFCAVVNMSADGRHWSEDNIELFGSGPDDSDSDAALTTYADTSIVSVGEPMCIAATVGWTRCQGGRYRIWASSHVSAAALTSIASGFKVILRCGDDQPVVYDGSWMKGHVVDDLLVFDFVLNIAPQLETGKYDQVAFPHNKLQVADLWGLAKSAPAMTDLVMMQLDQNGDYIASGQLDAQNTTTEWRRADAPGQRVDAAPWRLSGEAVASHWPEIDDRNHSIQVNLDYIAPDVDSLVFICKARPQLDADENNESAGVHVPQLVLMAPSPKAVKAAAKNGASAPVDGLLLGTYACPSQNMSHFQAGDAVVMCRLFRRRRNGPATDSEWGFFESVHAQQPRGKRAPPSYRRSPGIAAGGYMGDTEIVPLSGEAAAFYGDAPRDQSGPSSKQIPTHASITDDPKLRSSQLSFQAPPVRTVVGQQVQPSSAGSGVRTLVETPGRDGSPPHLSMRVGGGWVKVPSSPRPDRARAASPDSPVRAASPPPQAGTPREAGKRSTDSQWFLQTVGRPLVGKPKPQTSAAGSRWGKVRAVHAPPPKKRSDAMFFKDACEEMKGWDV